MWGFGGFFCFVLVWFRLLLFFFSSWLLLLSNVCEIHSCYMRQQMVLFGHRAEFQGWLAHHPALAPCTNICVVSSVGLSWLTLYEHFGMCYWVARSSHVHGCLWRGGFAGSYSRCAVSLSRSCPGVFFKVGGANPTSWVRRSDWSTSSSTVSKVSHRGVQ